MTGRRITGWGVVALAAAAAVLAAIIVLAFDVGSVQALPLAQSTPSASLTASTGSVSVQSDRPLPARFAALSPGTTERWRVTATVTSMADLDLRLERTGVLASRPDGLALAVALCPVAWTADGVCTGTSSSVVPSTSLNSNVFDQALPVGRVPTGSATHLLLSFSLPDSAASRTDRSLMGQTATVVVTVAASGGVAGGSGSGGSGSGVPNGGVRPGAGSSASGSAGSGSSSGGLGQGATIAGSGGSAGSITGGFGAGVLAWTGSWAALPAGVGVGLVLGGLFLVVQRRRSRHN